MVRRALSGTVALFVLAASGAAHAAVGPACDINPPTSTQACIDAIQASGGVVNDIFRDSLGRTALQLPVFGKLHNIYPGCDAANCTGCDPGMDLSPYDCPGEYACDGGTRDPSGYALFTDVAAAVGALDHVWGHPCRLTQHSPVNGCPQWGTCVTDGTPGNYYPWEGFVFDLGGLSNQVAIFAMNDHGPQPCESLEYTVFLTNNPQSQEIVADPATTGADPNKWNRAVLSKVFTEGWYTTRQPDPAGHGTTCGDTSQYSVEEDAFVQVFKLPCGADFQYAAVVAGNDGNDFPACAYDSAEAELDAVAGLTEQGAGVQLCLHPPCATPFDSPCVDAGGLTAPDAGTSSGGSSGSGGSGSGSGAGGSGGGGGDGGLAGDATVGGAGGTFAGTSRTSGCGCGIPGTSDAGLGAALAALAALVSVAATRARRTRPRS